ncbi:hypothetical protein LCGC14_2356990 [marine sediment metagenome]|uniref:Uncharacterized protein n=1 Tax=marine sediment metagenome TaxID=412755 RepID=A0A0F9EKA7_9ZZZZ
MMHPVLQDLYKRIWDGAEIVYCGFEGNTVRITTKEYKRFDVGENIWIMTYFALSPDDIIKETSMANDTYWII